MTSTAARLLDDFQTLAPAEQWMVRERVLSLTEHLQSEAVRRLHGAGAGRALVARLLADRAGERARD